MVRAAACGLWEQAVGVTVADPARDERGWAFRDGPGFSRDPTNRFQFEQTKGKRNTIDQEVVASKTKNQNQN